VHSLKDEQVDMTRVSISKSYAILVGLEAYTKTRKKLKHGFEHAEHQKDKTLHPVEFAKMEEEQKDKSESAEKERKLLAVQFRHDEELKKRGSLGTRMLRKLGLKSKHKDELSAQTGGPLSVPGEDVESAIPPEGRR
jgi:hypothetical protein